MLRQVDLSVEKSNLARYLPAQTAEKLATRKDLFGKPSEHQVAVLFADLVGFTKWAENKPTCETISVILGGLAKLTDVVFQHNGILDKFIGDGLMATFRTLENRATDATNAFAIAVAMRQASQGLAGYGG